MDAGDIPRISIRRRRRLSGLAFTAPAATLVAVFLLYPVVSTLVLALFKWNGFAPVRKYVGIDNFVRMAGDDRFFRAFTNTLIWGLVTVPAMITIGFVLAVLLSQRLWMQSVLRSVFVLPTVLSALVMAALWTWIYNPQVGALNTVLGWFSEDLKQVWLGNPRLALPSAMVASVWRWVGLNMIFYLAGLQSVGQSVVDAARIDGASALQMATKILAPLTLPTTALLALLGVVGTFRQFETVFILTNGGPAGTSEILSLQIFKFGFETGQAGYAAAISTVLLAVSLSAAFLMLWVISRANRFSGRQ